MHLSVARNIVIIIIILIVLTGVDIIGKMIVKHCPVIGESKRTPSSSVNTRARSFPFKLSVLIKIT